MTSQELADRAPLPDARTADLLRRALYGPQHGAPSTTPAAEGVDAQP